MYPTIQQPNRKITIPTIQHTSVYKYNQNKFNIYTSTIYIAPLTSLRSVCTLAFALSTSDRRYNQLGYSIYRQHQRLLQIFDCCGQSADGLRLLQQIVFFQQMFQGK